MPPLPLTLAINPSYDHVRDVMDGTIPVEGVDLTCLNFQVEEIFFRFSKYREWQISELSLAKYCSLRGSGDDSLIAIPVFPSRVFRHSAIYVRAGSPVEKPEDLRGRAIGIPEWTLTATVWVRGLLEHEYGVALGDVDWVQGGVNEPGRVELVPAAIPEGVRYRTVSDDALNDLLISGEIDAVVAPNPPAGFMDGSGRVVRLVEDYPEVERAYWERTGVFPIMHVIALQRAVYDAHPWVAMNLFTAFEEAKRRSYQRLFSPNVPSMPLPWMFAHAERARAMFGEDYWPYGLEPNRRTLETFLGYAHEQGVTAVELSPDDLFAVETAAAFRI